MTACPVGVLVPPQNLMLNISVFISKKSKFKWNSIF